MAFMKSGYKKKKLWEVLCGNESEIFIMHSQCQYLQAMSS